VPVCSARWTPAPPSEAMIAMAQPFSRVPVTAIALEVSSWRKIPGKRFYSLRHASLGTRQALTHLCFIILIEKGLCWLYLVGGRRMRRGLSLRREGFCLNGFGVYWRWGGKVALWRWRGLASLRETAVAQCLLRSLSFETWLMTQRGGSVMPSSGRPLTRLTVGNSQRRTQSHCSTSCWYRLVKLQPRRPLPHSVALPSSCW